MNYKNAYFNTLRFFYYLILPLEDFLFLKTLHRSVWPQFQLVFEDFFPKSVANAQLKSTSKERVQERVNVSQLSPKSS